jgi:hypothetical protein
MRFALVGMFALSLLKGCDLKELTSPDAVSRQFQDGLQPYFPNAKATAFPDQQVILGFTCIQGDGRQLVHQVGETFSSIPDIQKLKTLRDYGPLLGSPTYRYAALGFESGVIRLDVDTWESVVLQPWDGYDAEYRSACGLQPRTDVSHVVETGPALWLGHFTVTLAKPFNGRKQIPLIDSLGLYESAEFQTHRAAELKVREQMIREDLAAHSMEAITIHLDSVERVTVPASMLPH